jgi:hypothetical protein
MPVLAITRAIPPNRGGSPASRESRRPKSASQTSAIQTAGDRARSPVIEKGRIRSILRSPAAKLLGLRKTADSSPRSAGPGKAALADPQIGAGRTITSPFCLPAPATPGGGVAQKRINWRPQRFLNRFEQKHAKSAKRETGPSILRGCPLPRLFSSRSLRASVRILFGFTSQRATVCGGSRGARDSIYGSYSSAGPRRLTPAQPLAGASRRCGISDSARTAVVAVR